MPTKKENDIQLNVQWHLISVSHTDTSEDIMKKVSSLFSINDFLIEELSWYTIPNDQLKAENETLVRDNNTLNFNIEIQVMMLNKLKEIVWEDKYNEIKKDLIKSDSYLKLKDRAWL